MELFAIDEEKNGKMNEENGERFWYVDGVLHREDGPATKENGPADVSFFVGNIDNNFIEILKNRIFRIKYNDYKIILCNDQIWTNNIILYNEMLKFINYQIKNDAQVIEPLVDYFK
jgi:hypothetical protein